MTKFIEHIKLWLNKPYSFREELDFQLTASIIVSFVVFLVLYILKPFGLHTLDNNLFYYFAGYGIITLCVLLIIFFIINPIFPKLFADETWTVKKEIIFITSVTFIVGSIAWYYHHKVAVGGNLDPEKFTYLFFLKYTVSIGIFPVILYVYLTEMLLTSSRKSKSRKIKDLIKLKKVSKSAKDHIIIINSSNNKNNIELNISNLVFVKSEGNYVSFYLNENKENLSEHILRVQLQVVEKELESYKQFIRCHKSYIINTNYIENVTGNARGLTLHLSVSDTLIPVSRKFKKEQLISLIS